MSKLVIGSSKTNIVPAIVRDVSPQYYIEKRLINGYLQGGNTFIDLTGVRELGGYALSYAYNYSAFGGIDIDLTPLKSINYTSLDHTFFSATGINFVKTPQTGNNFLDSTDVKKVEVTAPYLGDGSNSICRNCKNLIEISFPNLRSFIYYSGNEMCYNCINLTTVSMENLTWIGVDPEVPSSQSSVLIRAFAGCTSLQSINWPKLKRINTGTACEYLFGGASNLNHINISSLEEIGDNCSRYMFNYCLNLPTVKFESLTLLRKSAFTCGFYNCQSLSSVWFYLLNSIQAQAMSSMLSQCTDVTVHFPIALQASYSTDSRFTGGFGGTNTTVLFDLVTSLEGANSETYTRQEKNSTSTATAWVNNDVLYYTSGVSDNAHGVNEPQVGDTIYSDAACTTAVTTISTIA